MLIPKIVRAAAVVVVVAAFPIAIAGQSISLPRSGDDDRERLVQLGRNAAKLKTTITMDRDEYFPGEMAEATIKVENPSAESLQVLKLFHFWSGRVQIFRFETNPQRPGRQWIPLAPDDIAGVRPDATAPTSMLSPGEIVERKIPFNGPDDTWDDEASYFRPSLLPTREGTYRVSYRDGSAQFRIVYPQIESWTAGPILAKRYEYHPMVSPGAPARGVQLHERHVPAMVLSYNRQHIVVVTHARLAAPDPSFIAKGEGCLTDDVQRQFGFFRRVATTDRAIVSLEIQAIGETDDVIVAYTEEGGRNVHTALDSNRHPIRDH